MDIDTSPEIRIARGLKRIGVAVACGHEDRAGISHGSIEQAPMDRVIQIHRSVPGCFDDDDPVRRCR
jgi:hypothetical protein